MPKIFTSSGSPRSGYVLRATSLAILSSRLLPEKCRRGTSPPYVEATSNKDLLAAVVAEIKTNGLMNSLVARLDESRDTLPSENAAVLLPAMFDIAQSLVGARSGDPFNTPWIFAWRATSWYLKSISRDVRGTLTLEALQITGALSVGSILIKLNDPENREENNRPDFAPALDPATVKAMKIEWLRQIRARAADVPKMLDDPDLMSLLYRWREYGSETEPLEWIVEAISTDKGFATLASRMMCRGTRSSAGDLISTPYNSFQRETVESFIGIDKAKAKCDVINPALFPEHEDALRTLLRYLEKWLGLRDHDPFNF